MDNTNDYLTVQEVSDELGIPKSTLHNHVYRGFLKAKRIGCQWLITYEDMREYARMREERPDSRKKFWGHAKQYKGE